jgi:hypothetical protein
MFQEELLELAELLIRSTPKHAPTWVVVEVRG